VGSGERPDELTHLADPGGIEPVARFVEQEELRTAQQRPGDPEPLLHPQRVGPIRVVGA